MALFSEQSIKNFPIIIKFKVADITSEWAFSFVKSIFPLFLIYKENLGFTKEKSYFEARSATLNLILIGKFFIDCSENSAIRTAVKNYFYVRGVCDDCNRSRTTIPG